MSQELNGTLSNSANLVGTFGSTGGGTSNYNDLTNKPQINGVELKGNKTTSNLNISYNDLINKPTIPAAQVNSDWNSSSGVSEILNKPTLAAVATSGSYDDLTNKPSIPAAQVNSDWNSSSGVSEILNKPTLAAVATSGSYDDLTNKPTIPAAQVNSDWNSSSGVSEILNKPTLAAVATSGDYTDLTNTPSIPVNSDFSLSGLSDVDTTGATSGQVLAYDGSKWANSDALKYEVVYNQNSVLIVRVGKVRIAVFYNSPINNVYTALATCSPLSAVLSTVWNSDSNQANVVRYDGSNTWTILSTNPWNVIANSNTTKIQGELVWFE